MKILHPLLCYFPSQAGGPANTLYWINNALNPLLFSTEVVSTTFGLSESTAEVEYQKNHKVTFLKSVGKSFVLFSIKKLQTAQIIQFSSLFFAPTLPILLVGILKNKTIIISPRGELYPSALNQKKVKKQLLLGVLKRLQKHINFHATNVYESNIIKSHFPKAKNIDIIPNYIALPPKIEIEPTSDFVFVGRINPIKNIDILIDSFFQLGEKYNLRNVRLNIIGSARLPYEIKYLKELEIKVKQLKLEKNVKFLGHLEGTSRDKIIASSKALLLPSKSENFGNVVLEALAQSTPVIASKNTPWQVLQCTKCGMWVDASAEDLAKSIFELLNMDDLEYCNMRKNALNLCKSKFDVQTNVKVWENYYKKITTYVQD